MPLHYRTFKNVSSVDNILNNYIQHVSINHLNKMELLKEMEYTWEQVADVLMVSRTTLWRRLTEIDISLSSYSDSELDGVMELLVRDFPRNGIVMMWGQFQLTKSTSISTESMFTIGIQAPHLVVFKIYLHLIIRSILMDRIV